MDTDGMGRRPQQLLRALLAAPEVGVCDAAVDPAGHVVAWSKPRASSLVLFGFVVDSTRYLHRRFTSTTTGRQEHQAVSP